MYASQCIMDKVCLEPQSDCVVLSSFYSTPFYDFHVCIFLFYCDTFINLCCKKFWNGTAGKQDGYTLNDHINRM